IEIFRQPKDGQFTEHAIHGPGGKLGSAAVPAFTVDLEALLFEWLSSMVYWKDAAGVVFREAPLTLTRDGEGWLLRARLIGAPVNHLTQELHADVKGVTKHLYDLKQTGGCWKVRVVLDV
ncbi:MAG: archease, partial [Nitrospirales bacterium]